jgi:spore coat polysaccharide biosynthesis predicted glycosyltransferase SpsG
MAVLCWVDAGPAAGLGHVSRGLALAEALAERGLACRFALPRDPTALTWLRAARAHHALVLPERQPALPHVLAAAAEAAALVVDVRRPLTRPEVRALGACCPVLLVDNAGAGVAEADLVLAPAPERRDPRWLAGPAWVPLRRSFRLAGDLRGLPHSPPFVLVAVGATDPGGLAVPVLEGLALARAGGARFSGRVVAYPLSPAWERLPAPLRRLDMPPPCAIQPGAMAGHLAEADLAVVGMGMTAYEAMACGVPALVLCRTSADAARARALACRGAVTSLGPHWREEDLAAAVAALLGAPARRAAMGRAGRALVDGRGA